MPDDDTPTQLGKEDLAAMTDAAIVEALEEGRFNVLLGKAVQVEHGALRDPEDEDDNPDAPITEEQLATMEPEAISTALRAGDLNHLLARKAPDTD